jgi:putative transposase
LITEWGKQVVKNFTSNVCRSSADSFVCRVADWQSAGHENEQGLRVINGSRVANLRYSRQNCLRYGVASPLVVCYSVCVTVPEPNPGLNRVKFQLRADGIPPDQHNPLRSGIHSRGYLPHVKREGASYFVTFRLADSLPREVLLRFEREHAQALREMSQNAKQEETEEINRELRRKIERFLDQGHGECLLRRSEIADLATEALLHYDGQQYLLDEWVVMPNHIHVVLWPKPNFTLSEILKGRKRQIARQANLVLGRTGETFWQRESYDHWIRNDEEKSGIRRYIRMNPVKACLCKAPEEWKWSSAWPGWNAAQT